jgi:hypothetical protein
MTKLKSRRQAPKGALWAENCPNFLAGKTEVFSGKKVFQFMDTGRE